MKTINNVPYMGTGEIAHPFPRAYKDHDFNNELNIMTKFGVLDTISSFSQLYPEYKDYIKESSENLELLIRHKKKDGETALARHHALNYMFMITNKTDVTLYIKDKFDNILEIKPTSHCSGENEAKIGKGLSIAIHYNFTSINDKINLGEFPAKLLVLRQEIFNRDVVYVPEIDAIVGTKDRIQLMDHPYKVNELQMMFRHPEKLVEKVKPGCSLELRIEINKQLSDPFKPEEVYVMWEYSDIPIKIKTHEAQLDVNHDVVCSLLAYNSENELSILDSRVIDKFTDEDIVELFFNKTRTKIMFSADKKKVRNAMLKHFAWLTLSLKDHNEAELEANMKLKEHIEELKQKHQEEIKELKQKIQTLIDERNDLQVQLKHYEEREKLELKKKEAELREKEIEMEKEKQKKAAEMMDKKIKQEEEKTKQNKYKSSSEKMKYGHIIVTTIISAAAAIAGWIVATSSKSLLALGFLL